MIKLLLVEDDPDMLDLTAYVLRRERFVVAEASDGAQAIRRWKADQPDLVILDLGLPSLDGFEVLRRIREDGNTPVLIVTGRRDAQDILRAFNLGTDDFVPKPFEFRELIARVRAILRRAKTVTQEVSEPRLQLDGLTLDPQTYEVRLALWTITLGGEYSFGTFENRWNGFGRLGVNSSSIDGSVYGPKLDRTQSTTNPTPSP